MQLPSIRVGDDILVGDEWMRVSGYCLTCHPDGSTTGDVFTHQPCEGKVYEPWSGYRIPYQEIKDVHLNDNTSD